MSDNKDGETKDPPPEEEKLLPHNESDTGINFQLGEMSPELPRNESGVSQGINSKNPAEKVRFILNENKESSHFLDKAHSIFCQMDLLCHFENGQMGWKEASRWLKYEEKVDSGDRWSKPHVSTTSLHSIMEIRRQFADDEIVSLLDVDASHGCVHQVADLLVQAVKDKVDDIDTEKAQKIREVFLKPHKHKHRKGQKKSHTLTHNDTVVSLDEMENGTDSPRPNMSRRKSIQHMADAVRKRLHRENTDPADLSTLYMSYPSQITPESLEDYKPNKRLMKKIPPGAEAANILVGQVDFIEEPIMVFMRLGNAAVLGDLTEVTLPTRFLFMVLAPKDSDQSVWEYAEYGRAMASCFTDRVFCEVAYRAHDRQDLLDGIDEYMDDLTVLPPSIWDPATRLDPPAKTRDMDEIEARLIDSSRRAPKDEGLTGGHDEDDGSLERTGRLFGGLIRDVKRKLKFYISDITDGFHLQCAATVFFLYFACITPIITFGLMLGDATDGYMGTMECLLSGAICGLTYHTFSGQPLTIVGATGPLLVFEGIVYALCRDNELHFLSFRFWIGMWIALILLIFVAFDLSALVRYITRFTEESFSVLISFIFIFEAFKKLFKITNYYPLQTGSIDLDDDYRCYCEKPYNETMSQGYQKAVENFEQENKDLRAQGITPNITTYSDQYTIAGYNWTEAFPEFCKTYLDRLYVSRDCVSEYECVDSGWNLVGDACGDKKVTNASPDVFLFSCIMFFATFKVALFLKKYRNSPYFPTIVRGTISDFAVVISIMICVGLDAALGLDTPKLAVPEKFTTTLPGRGWVVNPFAVTYWWLIIVALVPAILATILIFLDQQITAVIVNRKDHKLKKSHGYHLDLFVLCILIAVCSTLGLPWFVAATVRSITHVRSLFRVSETTAPGERPQFLGVWEQRLTGICIHILIGASVLMTPLLKYVPMAVLYGVFLYMGYTSLKGVQFVDRIRILFMPAKNQPDYVFLRHVDIKRVHIFTVIQIICMAIMWILKSIKSISITFPVMILGLCFIRYGMEFFFTQSEMFWLDHLLPEGDVRKKDDEEKVKQILDAEHEPEEPEFMDSKPKTAWDQLVAERDIGDFRRPRTMSKSIIDRNKPTRDPDADIKDEKKE